MMDKLSLLNVKQSSINKNEIRKPEHGIRRVGTGNRKEDIIKAAKEMESLFAYQLIKTMRETADTLSTDKKGLGNSTYMSMFDMEVSKLFAERGLGLQKAIVNWMERMPNINKNDKSVNDIDDEKY